MKKTSFFFIFYFSLYLIFLSFYHSFQTRPGPRPGGFWPGHRVNYFFKSKRRYFCKKKTKVNGLQPGLAGSTGSLRQLAGSRWVFPSPIFFFNPARFHPRVGRVPGRLARPGWISKLCILHLAYLSLFFIFIFRNIFLVFFFFTLFLGKKYYFLFFILWIFITLHSVYIYIYIYIYIFVLSLLFFCDFFIYILKMYYTKTKKMVFHNNNYNIALFFCYVKS